MTQRQITHPAGVMPPCASPCARSPKNFHDSRAPHAGGGHAIECSSCDRRTPKAPTFEAALQEWCRLVGAPIRRVEAELTNVSRHVRAIR
jgi:hypothetical protein